MNRRRRAWSAAAAGLLVVFIALPALGFLWTLATGPTIGDALGYWLVGGAVRRAQVG